MAEKGSRSLPVWQVAKPSDHFIGEHLVERIAVPGLCRLAGLTRLNVGNSSVTIRTLVVKGLVLAGCDHKALGYREGVRTWLIYFGPILQRAGDRLLDNAFWI
nr:hypothetical protein [Allorhizocola rhizosphaerae]